MIRSKKIRFLFFILEGFSLNVVGINGEPSYLISSRHLFTSGLVVETELFSEKVIVSMEF